MGMHKTKVTPFIGNGADSLLSQRLVRLGACTACRPSAYLSDMYGYGVRILWLHCQATYRRGYEDYTCQYIRVIRQAFSTGRV